MWHGPRSRLQSPSSVRAVLSFQICLQQQPRLLEEFHCYGNQAGTAPASLRNPILLAAARPVARTIMQEATSGPGSFGSLRRLRGCFRSTLFSGCTAGCGKTLLIEKPLSRGEDPNNGPNVLSGERDSPQAQLSNPRTRCKPTTKPLSCSPARRAARSQLLKGNGVKFLVQSGPGSVRLRVEHPPYLLIGYP